MRFEGKIVAVKHNFTNPSLVLAALVSLVPGSVRAQHELKVLAVVAHPDDEYTFCAATYRIARELGGTVDQVVITNGEAGYRYSVLAEKFYGLHLTDEQIGRENLPEIRKEECLAAGRILGIRQHRFLDQKDNGFTLSAAEGDSAWDKSAVESLLTKLLVEGRYAFVFLLLPAPDTHGQHKAATLLALEAVASLAANERPVVFGVEPAASSATPRVFGELADYPLTRAGNDVREFQRSRPFGFHQALNYEIIANWVIAAHKSQGLLQMNAGQHDVERFWRFEVSGPHSEEAANGLFERLNDTNSNAFNQAVRSQP